MPITVPQTQIEFRKKAGRLGSRTVWHQKLRGGLHLMTLDGGEIIGSGSHRQVARHTAQETKPDLEWTELSKGEHYPLESYEHLLPEYRELTTRLRKAQGF